MGKNCNVQYAIEGIYGWGKGFYTPELAKAWELFWFIHDGETVGTVVKHFQIGIMDNTWGTPYLYGLSGTCHCHPMELTGHWHTSNSAESETFEYERKSVYDFLTTVLAPFIKEKTGVDIKVTERYYITPEQYGEWNVTNYEEKTA